MDGITIMFFKALSEDDQYLTWEKLKDALCEKYGGLREAKVYEQLSVLQQDGSVDEYIREFESLVAQGHRLQEARYVQYFIHGHRERDK
jgi:Fe2+ or Zn2+ uptake regulation protein